MQRIITRLRNYVRGQVTTLQPGLAITTRGAKADISGTARVFVVSPVRGWVSLKGIDGT
jgi:hypothetical protein